MLRHSHNEIVCICAKCANDLGYIPYPGPVAWPASQCEYCYGPGGEAFMPSPENEEPE
jgi:hypothetical protein